MLVGIEPWKPNPTEKRDISGRYLGSKIPAGDLEPLLPQPQQHQQYPSRQLHPATADDNSITRVTFNLTALEGTCMLVDIEPEEDGIVRS